MSDVFISYAHSTARQARAAAETLRSLGYSVWLDEDLPVHRAFSPEIEQQLTAAKAALVIWSAEAATSTWVLSEANRALEANKLVQLRIDGARLPMPFDQIQCAELSGWSGDGEHPAWRKVAASIQDLVLVGGRERPALIPSAATAALPLPDKPSVAVMPFANLSGDAEQDYFADGMVEEIVAALSRVKAIFVVGSGSTLSFKGKAVTPRDIGRQLGVRYLLEGSVRKAAERVRISVKLTEAADGAQVWADHFDDKLADVFELQDRVAIAVAGVIEPAVRSAEVRRVARKPTANPSSYDLYLRAVPLTWPIFKERVMEARDLLEKAIDLDPQFASAMARLASCYAHIIGFRWQGEQEDANRRRSLELARRAVLLAPDDAEVLAWSGYAMMIVGPDWNEGAPFAERAVTLNPSVGNARFVRGRLQLFRGDPERAIGDCAAALRLDPVSARIQAGTHTHLGIARFQQGKFAEAAALLHVAAAHVGSPMVWSMLAAALAQAGDVEGARKALARSQELAPEILLPIAVRRPEHRKLFEEGIAIAGARVTPEHGG